MIGLGSNKRKCELAGRLGLILVALLVHPRGLRKLHVASCMLYCEECKPLQKSCCIWRIHNDGVC